MSVGISLFLNECVNGLCAYSSSESCLKSVSSACLEKPLKP